MQHLALDLVIAVPLAAMLIKGMKNGFAHEILALVGQIVAVFMGFTYMETMGRVLTNIVGLSGPIVPLLGFLLVYIIFIILVHIIIKVVNKAIKFAFLSVFNMILGAFFSMFKALLVLSVVFILFAGFNVPGQETRQNSYLYSLVLPVAPATYNVVAFIYPGVTSFAEEAGEFLERYNPIRELKDLNSSQ